MEIIVVSIGTLSKNPLWNERAPVRTSHATTTAVQFGNQWILVDPSLPGQILEAKLFERTGQKPAAINTVFLTNWRPVHRRGLPLFENARWLMFGDEIRAAEEALQEAQRRLGSGGAGEQKMLEQEAALLKRVEPAPDKIADGVDLFPLPGYTPGQCGLLISQSTTTLLIAGDAVPTAGHFAAGQVFADSYDLEKAKASLAEVYEIADAVIPGHDNIFVNPRAAGF